MEAPEELRARATLEEMQQRISQGPYAALGVTDAAAPDEVRAAFLALTKQFHPARFARMAPELHRLSNEVFIGIKTAHDALMKQLGAGRGGAAQQSGGIPVIGVDGAARARTTGGMPAVARPATFPRGTERPSQPTIPRTMTPSSPPANRAPTGPMPRVTSTQPTRTQTEPIRGAQRAPGTPALGTPVTRPTTPSGTRPVTPVSRPTPATGGRPLSPPPPQPYNPDTVRHAGVPKEPPFDERAALREALMLLNEQSWSPARQVLSNLAARVPQSKNYRALLGYARGREAQVAGRNDDAALEYQRALQLDPELAMAKAALAEVQRRR